MIIVTTSKERLIFIPLDKKNYSWSERMPNYLTYEYDGLKISEPFYIPLWDDEDGIRKNYKIVSTTNDITEEQAKEIVAITGGKLNGTCLEYMDYCNNSEHYAYFDTAKESFYSLMKANALLDLYDNYLILKEHENNQSNY